MENRKFIEDQENHVNMKPEAFDGHELFVFYASHLNLFEKNY